MANPGHDLVKTRIRDTLSSERQVEIKLLVSRLAQFEPTKIAVEAAPTSRLNDRYAAYAHGRTELSADEIEQIGFRLAKTHGHDRLFPVDFPGDMDFPRLREFAQAHRQMWFVEELESYPRLIREKLEEMDRRFTVSQILSIHNSPESLRFMHSLYVDMLRVNAGAEYPGVDVVTEWYRRNLTIFANIRRIVERSSDRILVIIGAGHAKILRDVVECARDLESVDPIEYLPEVPGYSIG